MALSRCATLQSGLTKDFKTQEKKFPKYSSSSFCVRKKRERCLVVAMNPVEAPLPVMAEPVTKDDLVQFFASGCKPKDQWRIGTEHEKFGYDLTTLRPLEYEQLRDLMNGISERFNWDKIIEGDLLTGLKQGKQSISLEPGGQFELSGAPVETLHETCSEIHSHLFQAKAIAKEMNIGLMGGGFQPKWTLNDTPKMPKVRSLVILDNMSKFPYGNFGLDVCMRACTVQVNLDYSSEKDMVKKLRAALSLQPIATAIFASSPFNEGKPTGYLTTRSYSWSQSDKARCGMLPFVFNDSFGFEDYVEFGLDLPMYCISRNNKYIDCSGVTFRDFMQGKLPQLPGERPTLKDWEDHIGFIYPEARLKKYMEMRGADCGSLWSLWAVPAFWAGLLYDEVSLQNVLDLIDDWTNIERQMLHQKVPILGLKTPFRGEMLRDVAEKVLKIAKGGLERRGYKEAGYLKEVTELVATGTTQAEKLLESYHGKYGRNIDRIFEELTY